MSYIFDDATFYDAFKYCVGDLRRMPGSSIIQNALKMSLLRQGVSKIKVRISLEHQTLGDDLRLIDIEL